MHRLKAWYITGFAVLMMITGGLLFWAEAEKLYRSPTFRWKLVFLVIAGLNAAYYEFKYVPKMDDWDGKTVLPSGAKLAGMVLAGQLGRGDRLRALDRLWLKVMAKADNAHEPSRYFSCGSIIPRPRQRGPRIHLGVRRAGGDPSVRPHAPAGLHLGPGSAAARRAGCAIRPSRKSRSTPHPGP